MSVDGSGRFVGKPPSGRMGARRRSSSKVNPNSAITKTDLGSKHSLVSKQPTETTPRENPDVFTVIFFVLMDRPKRLVMMTTQRQKQWSMNLSYP
jgi:hypothetical protein